MLANSVLGRLYGFWLCSAIFNLLRAIYRPFARAFHNSSIVNFLRRSPKIELYYAASVTGRVINAVWYWLVHVFSLAMKALYVPARHSAIVRAASGSHFCNFEFIMCASFLCMFVAPHSMWSNSYALLLALGLFGLYFLMAAAGSREAVSPLALGFPFLLFVLAVPVSFIFTTDMGDSVRVAMFFVAAFLFTYVFMADLSSTERLERLMRWIYFAVLLTAVYACYQRVVGVEVSASYTDLSLNSGVPGRVYSTLDNPNNYAEFLVLFTPLSVAWAMQRKKPTARFFACCGIALPLLALVMTYCRSGWLSIAVSALVFVYYLDKRLIPPAIVVCILAIPFLPDSIMTRLLSIFNSSDSSASFRILVWQGVLDMLGDYGLTGIGMVTVHLRQRLPALRRERAHHGGRAHADALSGALCGVGHSRLHRLHVAHTPPREKRRLRDSPRRRPQGQVRADGDLLVLLRHSGAGRVRVYLVLPAYTLCIFHTLGYKPRLYQDVGREQRSKGGNLCR